PDAILMDNYMPEMNGLDALIHLVKQPETKDIPVIMLSASLHDRDQALDEGARYFFQKPSPPETILIALDEVIGQSMTVGAN
ncbi:MAG: response regulator, partial [Pirellulales bacterium]